MTIKELYQTIGGNYEEALARFMNEDMLKMFFAKYFASTCYAELETAMESGDVPDVPAAFQAAHALKGLTLSMSFTKLGECVVALTEDLRAGTCNDQTLAYWQEVKACYAQVKQLYELL